MTMKKILSGVGLAAAVLAFAAAPAHAEWPEKPIDLVISFDPGGGMDQTMLPLKPLLEAELGQPLLFNYKPGAGGRIGFEHVFLNGADGYVIGALSEPHYTNTTVFDTPKYKHEDMVPVGLLGRDVPIWFVHKDSPYKDMNDLIAAAKENPGEITVAIGSFTGEHYITLAVLEDQADIKFRAVNVGGGAPVMSNVVGKHFDVGISRPASIAGIKDEIRGLGIVAAERSPIFPDTPTFEEQLPESLDIPLLSSSRGLMVHRDFVENNPEGFEKLKAALEKAAHSDEYKAALDRMGFPLDWVASEDAQKELTDTAAQMQQYKPLVEAAKGRE